MDGVNKRGWAGEEQMFPLPLRYLNSFRPCTVLQRLRSKYFPFHSHTRQAKAKGVEVIIHAF